MYTNYNFKTKKALKEFIASGKKCGVFQPGPFGQVPNYTDFTGTVTLEGPHYPQPHKWYAQATLVDGFITKVK